MCTFIVSQQVYKRSGGIAHDGAGDELRQRRCNQYMDCIYGKDEVQTLQSKKGGAILRARKPPGSKWNSCNWSNSNVVVVVKLKKAYSCNCSLYDSSQQH